MVATAKKQCGEEKTDPCCLSLTRPTIKLSWVTREKNQTTCKTGAVEQINHGVFNAIWNNEPVRNTNSEEKDLQTAGGVGRHSCSTNSKFRWRTIGGRVKQRVFWIFKQLHMHYACTPKNDMVQGTHEKE